MWKLIGSAASQDALKSLIEKRWYWKDFQIVPSGDEYHIVNSRGIVQSDVRVLNKKGRWRLEMFSSVTS